LVIFVTAPVVSVNVPFSVPTALITPAAYLKPVVVRVPTNVPPGRVCRIDVVSDPPAGAAMAGGAVSAIGAAIMIAATKGARILLLVIIFLRN
jgi:hypothetical protein